ncbi:anti-sigma factor domain-containing protein [Falsibacillus pallidus]|uniref:Anti-sigma factor-like protein n=1 Tax=Falsibacillus pallidus TaxID=493781 RepID=A0A370GWP7_9BACI|nr:anti-sigma factor domain-containing protein [Falsibacillus pallidus]RDI47696.1 anti-sigma factor-like protein [Falsibacillus pallidus]
MNKKGIIMDIKEDYLIMLTADGQFLKGQKERRTYEIGEEVSFFSYEGSKRKKINAAFSKWMTKSGMAAASAAVIMLAFLLLQPFFYEEEVYAYVSIDINPSIELNINKGMKVIEAHAYNNDGKRILKNIDLKKHQSIKAAAIQIMEESKKEGYLKPQHNIVIATVPGEKATNGFTKSLNDAITTLESETKALDAHLVAIKGTPQERKDAAAKGLTTGKYLKEQNEKALTEKENPEKIKTKVPPKKKEAEPKQQKSPSEQNKGAANKGEAPSSKGNGKEAVIPRNNKNQNNPGQQKKNGSTTSNHPFNPGNGSEKNKNVYPPKNDGDFGKGHEWNHHEKNDGNRHSNKDEGHGNSWGKKGHNWNPEGHDEHGQGKGNSRENHRD